MPYKPKKPCAYPGCPNLTDAQYCSEHKALERKNIYRSGSRNPFNELQSHHRTFAALCLKMLADAQIPVSKILPVSGAWADFRNLETFVILCRKDLQIALEPLPYPDPRRI